MRESRAKLDTEGETLCRLATLREAVVGRKRTAEQTQDVDALRRAMHQCFAAVYLSPFAT